MAKKKNWIKPITSKKLPTACDDWTELRLLPTDRSEANELDSGVLSFNANGMNTQEITKKTKNGLEGSAPGGIIVPAPKEQRDEESKSGALHQAYE